MDSKRPKVVRGLIRLARGSKIILLVFGVVDGMFGDAKRCESIHMFFYHALLCFDLLETWNFVIEWET
jgi:hypothetical protein